MFPVQSPQKREEIEQDLKHARSVYMSRRTIVSPTAHAGGVDG